MFCQVMLSPCILRFDYYWGINTAVQSVIDRYHDNTYYADPRLEVSRQVEAGEESLVWRVVELHLV